MGNDTYLGNSDVIKKLDDLSAAVGGTTVPTTTTKTNTDFVIGINKSIDAASGITGVEYPPYSHNTLVTDKLDELAGAIAAGGGGGPGPTPVMGTLSVTENGEYLPSSYNYDGFSSVSVDVPAPPAPVMGTLSVTENGDYLPSSYNYDGFSSVSVDVPEPTPMIGSNGAQRLTLPYYADDGISIEFKMMLSSNSSNRVIFGDLFDYDGTVLYTVGTNEALGARTQREWYSENLPYKSWNMVDVKLDIANGIFTIDGVDYGTGHVPTTHPSNYYLTLFDIYGGGRGASVAIGDVSIKQNDVEVMHLVPMKNSQTGAGYYHDSIGDQDYYSEGSKDFIYTEFGNASDPTTNEPGILSIADSPLTLSFDTSSDNHIIVDYEIPYNVTNMSVCGTSNGSNQLMHITTWGTALYIGTGSGEYIVGRGSSYVEGRHTFEFNRNGYIYFDDVQGDAITPSNNAITIGGRGGYNLYGLIYSVEIKSNSTGDTLLKLVPDEQNGEVGFTDKISNTFYPYGHKLIYSEINT